MPDESNYQQYIKALEEDEPFNYSKFQQEWKQGDKPILNAIMSNYTKPEQKVSPQDEKRAKFSASITDAVSSIAQMFAHGKGAMIQRNASNASSTNTTNARLKQIQDKYENDLLRYQSVKGNAEMQDFNQQMKSSMDAKGQKRQILLYKAQQEAKAMEEARRERIQLDKEKRKLESDKELIHERAAYRPAKAPSTKTPKIDPNVAVDINSQAEEIDKEWATQQGYMTKKPVYDRRKRVVDYTYSWNTKATPEIKRALVDKYNAERGGATQSQPKEQPKTTQQTSSKYKF